MKILTILIMGFLLASCSITQVIMPTPTLFTPTSTNSFCDRKEIDDFRGQFMPLVQKYYDQVLATSSAKKAQMAGQIELLEKVKSDIEKIITNPCTVKLRTALMIAVQNSMEGFLALLNNQSESVQESFFEQATQAIREMNEQLARLADCGTVCIP
jgi:hypothetical protein